MRTITGGISAAGVCLALMLGSTPSALAAGPRPGAKPVPPPLPQTQGVINLNLLDALVKIKEPELTGIFSFIPEASAAPALADFLLRDSDALKLFIKKGKRDLKETGAVNEWDQQVCLYMVSILSSGILPKDLEKVSNKWINDISALSLAPRLSLSEMNLRRKH